MSKTSIENIGLKYGIYSAVAYILFFFLMSLLGLKHLYWLRALNYIFLFAAIFLGIREYKRKHPHKFAYMNGLAVGMLTSVVSTLIFAGFIAIYLDVLDPAFMEQVKHDQLFGEYLTPYIAAAAILMEGTLSGVLTAYILMQYFKTSHSNEPEQSVP